MAFLPTSQLSIEEPRDLQFNMEDAIEHVFNREYILIVGSEVVLNPDVEPSGDINDYILRLVNQALKRQYGSFDEVLQHTGKEVDPIRNLLMWDVFRKSMEINDVSTELQGLMRTHLFKVVVTTTFDSYLEMLMEDIWGKDNLRIVNVWDTESLKAFYKVLSSYNKPGDYNEPTLIYAFGKCEEYEKNRYARKDVEYIQTIERWLELDKRENLMMQFILSKRLLSLGCKFDDWYFRFFWYILRREEDRQREGDIAIAFDRNDRSDQKLETYLKNSRVILKSDVDCRAFMRQFTYALSSLNDDNSYRERVLQHRRSGKIFFSYSNNDKVLARKLFQRLSSLYPNMWFDQEHILGGDDYDQEISRAISQATIFIPLLTANVADDLKNGRLDNYYNDEWRQAANSPVLDAVIPLAVDGFSPREEYYKTFEEIFGRSISCVERINALSTAIDEKLGQQ